MSEIWHPAKFWRYSVKNVADKVYGIDLDGVSVDFITDFSKFLKEYLNVSYEDSEITDYHWYKCDLGISQDEFWSAFNVYGMRKKRYEHLLPLPYANDGIRMLLENAKDVWFITGRPHYAYEQTTKSLRRCFDIPSDRIIFSSGEDYKSNVVNRLGIDVFFDDAPHYSESIAKHTNAQVYLMNTTYNQEVSDPNIIRVDGWKDFIAKEFVDENNHHLVG
jgi:uncharacterized protein